MSFKGTWEAGVGRVGRKVGHRVGNQAGWRSQGWPWGLPLWTLVTGTSSTHRLGLPPPSHVPSLPPPFRPGGGQCYTVAMCHTACRIPVPQAGVEPAPPAMEEQSLNHWTTREVQGAWDLE